MKIENLKQFLEIARVGSINKAASRLFTSHQNLNALIKNMEKELDTKLFIRNQQGVLLSEDGKELFRAAEQIVGIYEGFLTSRQKESAVIPFYTTPSLADLVNQLQGSSFEGKNISLVKYSGTELYDTFQSQKQGIYFFAVSEDNYTQGVDFADKYILAIDTNAVVVCHRDNPILPAVKRREQDRYKTLTNVSQMSMQNMGINIDDLNIAKDLMRRENYVFNVPEYIAKIRFPEQEWLILNKGLLEHKIYYTIFFRLPNTNIHRKIREDIIKTLQN